MTAFYIITAIVIVLVVLLYNGLVVARQRVREGWSDIATHLKRRYDLIPNLVETVQGYAAHEKSTFEQIVKARALAMNNESRGEQKAEAENVLSGALKSIFALGENYPDLKASTNFMELQQELSDTENKIQASRRFYNTMVMSLNSKVETFPTNIVAKIFGFHKEAFFEIDEAEKEAVKKAPKVSF